jgi:hypothetical protein
MHESMDESCINLFLAAMHDASTLQGKTEELPARSHLAVDRDVRTHRDHRHLICYMSLSCLHNSIAMEVAVTYMALAHINNSE